MLSGPSATYGEAVWKGVQLAGETLNAQGGILGRPVELEIKDNASDTTQAVNIVRGYGQDPSIPAVIPPTYQPNFEGACAVANQIGLPIVSAQSAPPPPEQNPNGFCFVVTSPIEDQSYETIRAVADQLELTRFALIYDQENAYQSLFNGLMAEYIEGQSDMELVENLGVNSEATDYGPQITSLRSAGAEVIIPNLTTEDAARFIQQANARGVDALMISPSTNLTNRRIYELSGGAAEGLITATNQSPEIPSYQEFLDAFEAKFGQVDDPSYSGYGYDALIILARAIEEAGSADDREAIRDALASMTEVCASICYESNGEGAFLTPELHYVEITEDGWIPSTRLTAE